MSISLIPIAAAIAACGLERFRTTRTSLVRQIVFVAFWGVVLALAIPNHDHVPRGQALVRAGTAPLAVAGLAMVFEKLAFERLVPGYFIAPAVAALPAIQAGYFLGGASIIELALGGSFAVGLFLTRVVRREATRQRVVAVLLTLIASEFTFQYVDYPVHRIGVVPASAIVLVLRMVAAALVLVGCTAAAIAAPHAVNRLSGRTVAALALIGLACVQVAYFYVDLFTNPTLRLIHVAVLLTSAAGVAALSNTRRRMTPSLGVTSDIPEGTILPDPDTNRVWGRFSRRHCGLASILAMTALAAVLRFWAITFGLPHTYSRPDENAVVDVALTMLRNGDSNPHFFHYPTLYMYVMAVVYLVYGGVSGLLDHFIPADELLTARALDPVPFYLLDRLVSALLGTVTVPLVYYAARRVLSSEIAMVAAFLTAVAFLHVRDSHFGVTDVPMTFMVMLAFVVMVSRRLDSAHPWNVLLAGAVCGLAASTKFGAAPIVLPLFVLIAESAWSDPRAVLTCSLLAAAGVLAGFLVGTPYAALDPAAFFDGLAFNRVQLALGHGPDLGRGWTYHLRISLRYGLGLPMVAAGLVGIARLLWNRRRAAWLILPFPLATYLILGSGRTLFVRYFMAVVPFVCMLAAVSIADLAAFIGRHVPNQRSMRFGVMSALTLALAFPSLWSAISFDRLIARRDNRLIAEEWLASAFPDGASVYQSGYHYGQLQFPTGQPFAQWSFDETRGAFVAGADVRPDPDLIVVQSSRVTTYSELPEAIARILRARYHLVRRFDVETVAGGNEPVFDLQDAFYVPLSGFDRFSRPGPALEIYERDR